MRRASRRSSTLPLIQLRVFADLCLRLWPHRVDWTCAQRALLTIKYEVHRPSEEKRKTQNGKAYASVSSCSCVVSYDGVIHQGVCIADCKVHSVCGRSRVVAGQPQGN